jgi:hypothetical protein
MHSTLVRSLHVGCVCCTDHLCDFGTHRLSCGIYSSTVKIQAMECSIVVGCYESPVGLRKEYIIKLGVYYKRYSCAHVGVIIVVQ